MKVAVGEKIRESIRKAGMTQEDFAKEMGMTPRNLANLLNKEHIPFDRLVKASKYLNKDFIKEYTDWLYETEKDLQPYKTASPLNVARETHNEYNKPKKISFSLNIVGDFESIRDNMTDLLEVVKKEAEDRGLELA